MRVGYVMIFCSCVSGETRTGLDRYFFVVGRPPPRVSHTCVAQAGSLVSVSSTQVMSKGKITRIEYKHHTPPDRSTDARALTTALLRPGATVAFRPMPSRRKKSTPTVVSHPIATASTQWMTSNAEAPPKSSGLVRKKGNQHTA